MDSTGALKDGGFESGGYTYWQQCGSVNASVQKTYVHSGSYAEAAGTGSAPEVNGDAGLCQQVTVPTNGTLTFWVKQGTNETSTTYAYQEGDLLDSTGAIVDNFYTSAATTSGWVQKNVNVGAYAGRSLWIYFGVHGDGYANGYVYQDVDDVAWSSTSTPTPAPSATPSPTPAPSATHSPTPAPSPTPTPAPTPTKSPTPSPTMSPTPSGGPTPIATPANGGGNSTGSCGTSCGVQRWHIKTLGDAYVNTINWTPQLMTVDQLRAAPVPANYDEYNDTTRYAPWETESVTVRATLVGWKVETDHDYHIVIADLNNGADTMIVEPPDPTCSSACDGGFASYFSAVRTKLVNCFGSPPSSFTNFAPGIIVDLTGVPEFDALHGQTGVAPNGIEIHPLMNVNFVAGTSCQ
jgi:cell division septation protein DedD